MITGSDNPADENGFKLVRGGAIPISGDSGLFALRDRVEAILAESCDMHRLKNPGVIPLVLIEIQSGSYLGEDDIVRFADVYGREG